MAHNGGRPTPDLDALIRQQSQPQQVAVEVAAGPNGERVRMPWQAALVWFADQQNARLDKIIALLEAQHAES